MPLWSEKWPARGKTGPRGPWKKSSQQIPNDYTALTSIVTTVTFEPWMWLVSFTVDATLLTHAQSFRERSHSLESSMFQVQGREWNVTAAFISSSTKMSGPPEWSDGECTALPGEKSWVTVLRPVVVRRRPL